MAARTPSASALESLREVFRRSSPSTPRDFRVAGDAAGVTEGVARRAWARGFVGVEPIEVQLARERGLQAQSAELLRVETLVRATNRNAEMLQGELIKLQPVVRALAAGLIERVAELRGLDAGAAVVLLDKLARMHGRVSSISQRAVELRRLVDGEATTIVGHKPVASEPVDLEQAKTDCERLARALRRAQGATTEEPTSARAQEDRDVDGSGVN